MNKANLKCPKCQGLTALDIPQDSCLQGYKCDNCQQIITLPKSSDKCCVVCAYSDQQCPMPNKKSS